MAATVEKPVVSLFHYWSRAFQTLCDVFNFDMVVAEYHIAYR